jgi:hypothetical protein
MTQQQQQQPLPPLPTTIPILIPQIAALLDDEGRVGWKFDYTLASKILGVELAKKIWTWIVGGQFAMVKTIFWLIFILAWIVLSVLEVFKIGGYQAYVTQMFITFSIMMFLSLGAMASFFLDLRIVKFVLFSQYFISNFSLAIVALISVCDIWGYDERSLLTGLLLAIIFFISLVDAFPPELRRILGLPVFVLLFLTFAFLYGIIALGRFPSAQERIIPLGTIGGLSSYNVTVSVIQVAGDASFAFMVLTFRLLLHTYESRNTGYMIRLTAPLRYVESNEVKVHFLDFLDFFKLKSEPIISTKMIKVNNIGISKILDENGRVIWSIKRTIFVRLFGLDTLFKIADVIIGGSFKIQVVKFSCIISFMTCFVLVAVCTLYGYIDTYIPMVIMTGIQIFLDILMMFILFDIEIFKLCLKMFDFWLSMSLGFLGSLAISLYWSFDVRTILVVPFLFLCGFVSSYDAVYPKFSETFAPIGLVLIFLFYALCLFLVQLGRLPDQHLLIYNVGTFDGLANRPVTISVSQMATDVLVGHMGMFLGFIYCWWEYRRDHVLHMISVRLQSAGDPNFTHFPILGKVQFLGLGEAFEQSRRVSVVSGVGDNNNSHSQQLVLLPGDSMMGAINPGFSGGDDLLVSNNKNKNDDDEMVMIRKVSI